MHIPKVSVLIPTYNAAKFLAEAIESVLDQTYTDFELIIVDNHSTDSTDAVVQQYLHNSRVSYHKNDVNIGMVKNWNKCLDLARGEYIKFLCADDLLHPQLLEKFVAVLKQHPTVVLVTSQYEEFGMQSWICRSPFHYLQNGMKIAVETLRDYNWLGYPSTVLFRRSALKVGKFREFSWLVDWDFWLRVLTTGDCYYVPEILSYVRNHETQVTKDVTKSYKRYLEAYYYFKALGTKNEFGLDLSGVDMPYIIRQKALICLAVAKKALARLYEKQSREFLATALVIGYREQVLAPYAAQIVRRTVGRVARKQ